MLTAERRREIADFLRACRARVKPEDVGLPVNGRRRTPGLRREEVAALAGVSTEWYTWVEQERPVRPSADVLARIGDALKLEPSAAAHLLTLAGYGSHPGVGLPHSTSGTSPHLQRLLDHLEPYPAWIYGERWDVVAWNRAAAVLYGGFDTMAPADRNMLLILFLDPRMHRMVVDWPTVARGIVAKVRAVHARYVGDPWFQEVIDRLCLGSEEFAGWWRDHEVYGHQDGVKRFDHPEVGRLTFDFSVLTIRDERYTNLSMTTYVPQPGTPTLESMQRLLAREPADVLVPAQRSRGADHATQSQPVVVRSPT